MALAPDLQTIVESYKFSNTERQDLIKYLSEELKQLELDSKGGEVDYDLAIELYVALPNHVKDFVEETAGYMIAWHYGTLDLVEALKDIINKLERS